jgi:hypothetical protein
LRQPLQPLPLWLVGVTATITTVAVTSPSHYLSLLPMATITTVANVAIMSLPLRLPLVPLLSQLVGAKATITAVVIIAVTS